MENALKIGQDIINLDRVNRLTLSTQPGDTGFYHETSIEVDGTRLKYARGTPEDRAIRWFFTECDRGNLQPYRTIDLLALHAARTEHAALAPDSGAAITISPADAALASAANGYRVAAEASTDAEGGAA